MAQLLSCSLSKLQVFSLFIVLLGIISNHQTSAEQFESKFGYHPSIYDDSVDDEIESPMLINNFYQADGDELLAPNPWSQLFHRYYARSVFTPRYYSSPQPEISLRRGEFRYVPYGTQKRAIPIELQKALFAHGIVGRRR